MRAVRPKPFGGAGHFDSSATVLVVCPGHRQRQFGRGTRNENPELVIALARERQNPRHRLTLPDETTGLHYPSRRRTRLPETRAVIRESRTARTTALLVGGHNWTVYGLFFLSRFFISATVGSGAETRFFTGDGRIDEARKRKGRECKRSREEGKTNVVQSGRDRGEEVVRMRGMTQDGIVVKEHEVTWRA